MRSGTSGSAKHRGGLLTVEHGRWPPQIPAGGLNDWRLRNQALRMQWRCIDRVLQRNIPGDHNHGHPAFRQRFADRDLEYPRHLVGAGDELAIVTAFLEEALWVGL